MMPRPPIPQHGLARSPYSGANAPAQVGVCPGGCSAAHHHLLLVDKGGQRPLVGQQCTLYPMMSSH